MSAVTIIQGSRGPKPGAGSPRKAVSTATQAWGELPEWLLVLAEACDASSQNVVAKRLGYSNSVVSAVLANSYKGAVHAVEKTVRGALMAEELDCPVLGALRKDRCLENQKKAVHFHTTSSLRVRLYMSCRGKCVHSRMAIEKGEAK